MTRAIHCVIPFIFALSIFGCVIENKSARDLNANDLGTDSIDGNAECSNVCAEDDCPSGRVVLDDDCRCLCEQDCAELACESCPEGLVEVDMPGACCPSCQEGCETDDDCGSARVCIEGVCADDCSELDCEECPAGYIVGSDATACCDCVPACGPLSPFVCNEGERCESGICISEDIDCENIECMPCPEGTESTPSDSCCPICEPISCACPEIYAPVCADGITYENECAAVCSGVEEFRPGSCEEGICGADPDCGDTCEMVMQCFEMECEEVQMRGFLVDGCQEACGSSGGELPRILCELSSCGEVVNVVTELSGTNFCGGAFDCDNPPPNIQYFGEDDECDFIDFNCPENAEYYRDECGCGCLFEGGSCEDFAPEGVRYVATGPECDFVEFDCGEGEEVWFDECGCGCVERDCGCPDFEDPVCAPDGRQYVNECEAACAGAFGARPCDNACECPDVYEPVCGLDSQTYDNACLADCVDMPIVNEGACFETDLCPDGFETECEDVCEVATECYAQYCSEDEVAVISRECVQICSEGAPLNELFCGFETCEEVVSILGPITGRDDACTVSMQGCPDRRFATYFADDPSVCDIISFTCEEGTTPFDNRCGCGCTTEQQCPMPGRDGRYVSEDPEVCNRITLECPTGSEAFSDDCGCGCLY